jgi:hypothetical protein
LDEIPIEEVPMLFLFFIVPVVLAAGIIPYWMIFKKAGFAPALSLLTAIPGINLIVLYVVAFSGWKTSLGRVAQYVTPNEG